MNKVFKKAAALGLCAALAMTSLAGCSKKEETFDTTQTAVTVNGTEISAGVVKFMTHYMQAATEQFYNQYFGAGSMNMAIDESGTTFGDMMKDQNVASLTQMVLAEQHMEEYGIALTDADKEAIAAAATAFLEENEEEVLTKMGATQADIERYLELNTIQVKMQPAMSADVNTEVSDEEAAQRKIEYTLITAETEAEEAETEAAETEAETAAETAALEENETAKTQSAEETEAETAAETEAETETETEDPAMAAAMDEAYAKAEQAIALIKDGEEFEAAVQSIDADLKVNEMTFDADDTYVTEGLITSTEGLADGTLVETPVEAASGYYVVRLVTQLDREATDAAKEEIVEQRKSDRIAELYAEWEEAAEITKNEEVLAKIVFNFSLTLEAQTEVETEAVTEAVTEAETEAVTEEVTEAVTEEVTEAVTEEVTEAVTEEVTEEVTEAVTEAVTEEVTEAVTEAVTEEVTEAAAEAVTEAESETEA